MVSVVPADTTSQSECDFTSHWVRVGQVCAKTVWFLHLRQLLTLLTAPDPAGAATVHLVVLDWTFSLPDWGNQEDFHGAYSGNTHARHTTAAAGLSEHDAGAPSQRRLVRDWATRRRTEGEDGGAAAAPSALSRATNLTRRPGRMFRIIPKFVPCLVMGGADGGT